MFNNFKPSQDVKQRICFYLGNFNKCIFEANERVFCEQKYY